MYEPENFKSRLKTYALLAGVFIVVMLVLQAFGVINLK
jgi:uncharacterized membrane protein (Fun14 family)